MKAVTEVEKLKPIPNTFRHHGYDQELILRVGRAVLYKQTNKEGVLHWEVHKVRIFPYPSYWNEASEWSQYERLASDEDFGYYGWSFESLERALGKFKEIAGQ